MTIVGLGVVTLLQVFSSGLRLQARSTARTETMLAGARVMDELLARKTLGEGPERGRLGGSGRWGSHIQTLRDAPSTLGLANPWELKEVTLELFVLDGARERQVELKTLRLAKKVSP